MLSRYLNIFIICILILGSGCSSLTSLKNQVFGKSSKKAAIVAQQIDSLEDKESQLNKQRLGEIGAWARGTDIALSQSTNKEPSVTAAQQTNERVIALADQPDFQSLKEVLTIVNQLMTNSAEAQTQLTHKDKTIIELNKSVKETRQERDEAIEKALVLSATNAQHADTYKSTLTKMDSFFGFGAIIYGVKKLIVKLAWGIGIGLVLFIVLRFAASANPIAGAIFSVFEQIVSWFIHAITAIAPKAVAMAGFVTSKINDDYKVVLTKVVDAVEVVQDRAKAANTLPLVSDVMTEMSKAALTPNQQNIITSIKKELNWVSQ